LPKTSRGAPAPDPPAMPAQAPLVSPATGGSGAGWVTVVPAEEVRGAAGGRTGGCLAGAFAGTALALASATAASAPPMASCKVRRSSGVHPPKWIPTSTPPDTAARRTATAEEISACENDVIAATKELAEKLKVRWRDVEPTNAAASTSAPAMSLCTQVCFTTKPTPTENQNGTTTGPFLFGWYEAPLAPGPSHSPEQGCTAPGTHSASRPALPTPTLRRQP